MRNSGSRGERRGGLTFGCALEERASVERVFESLGEHVVYRFELFSEYAVWGLEADKGVALRFLRKCKVIKSHHNPISISQTQI